MTDKIKSIDLRHKILSKSVLDDIIKLYRTRIVVGGVYNWNVEKLAYDRKGRVQDDFLDFLELAKYLWQYDINHNVSIQLPDINDIV